MRKLRQRGKITHLGSHSWYTADSGLNPATLVQSGCLDGSILHSNGVRRLNKHGPPLSFQPFSFKTCLSTPFPHKTLPDMICKSWPFIILCTRPALSPQYVVFKCSTASLQPDFHIPQGQRLCLWLTWKLCWCLQEGCLSGNNPNIWGDGWLFGNSIIHPLSVYGASIPGSDCPQHCRDSSGNAWYLGCLWSAGKRNV